MNIFIANQNLQKSKKYFRNQYNGPYTLRNLTFSNKTHLPGMAIWIQRLFYSKNRIHNFHFSADPVNLISPNGRHILLALYQFYLKTFFSVKFILTIFLFYIWRRKRSRYTDFLGGITIRDWDPPIFFYNSKYKDWPIFVVDLHPWKLQYSSFLC